MIRTKENLIVYHGTADKFTIPDLNHTLGQKDFGVGFYLTTDKHQAEQFAKRQSALNRTRAGYINTYNLSGLNQLRVLEFETADIRWLKFICMNRYTRTPKHGYDAIIGKIADDNTRRTLDFYADGFYTLQAKQFGVSPEEIVIKILEPNKLKNQICLCTELAISRLTFIKATVVR